MGTVQQEGNLSALKVRGMLATLDQRAAKHNLTHKEGMMKNLVKNTLIVLGAIALIVAGAWVGQFALPNLAPAPVAAESSDTTPPTRTITVVGEGTVTLPPDIAYATIGVETSGSTVKMATSEASETMGAVIAALAEAGIEAKDMQTSGYGVWADHDRDPSTGKVDGTTYRVNNSVRVTIRDLEAVGSILDAALEAGANSIHGVSFGIAEAQAQETEARGLAAEDALSRAQELAELHGLQVGEVLSISEVVDGGVYASNFRGAEYAKMGLGGAGSVSPGQLDLSLRLQVVYALR